MNKARTILASLAVGLAGLFATSESAASHKKEPQISPLAGLKNEETASADNDFITVGEDGEFKEKGKTFRFIGTNNYYLHYKDELMVEDVIKSASLGGFNVIRTWGFFDGMGQDYTNNHAYMQPSANVYTAPKGCPSNYVNCWERMDYAVSLAKQYKVKLILVFTNYWKDFGGAMQYVRWSDAASGIDTTDANYSPDVSKFYTDEKCQTYFKNYMNYFLNRTNTVTNTVYKDDPTIMGYELINEPRNPGKNTSFVTNWVKTMSAYFKTIDTNHLLGVGSEGEFGNKANDSFQGLDKDKYDGSRGVSYEDTIVLPDIDFGTYHQYVDSECYGSAIGVGNQWTKEHIAVSKAVKKPCVMEEFGIPTTANLNRAPIYDAWCRTLYDEGGAGGLFWMLGGLDTGDSALLINKKPYYPDYDGYRLLWLGETDSDAETLILHQYAVLFTSPDFAEFEDSISFLSPCLSDADITAGTPYVVDSDRTPVYRIEVVVVSSNKISRIGFKASYQYMGDFVYNEVNKSYVFDLPLKYFLRGTPFSFWAECYFEDGSTLVSKHLKIERLLSYEMEKSVAFDFAKGEVGPTLSNGGNCQVKYFNDVKQCDFNGGAIALDVSSDPAYCWSEFKVDATNFPAGVLSGNDEFDYDVYYEKSLCIPYSGSIPADSEAPETAPGFRNYAAVNPGWSKLCLNQNNIKATDCETVTIGGVDYYKQTVKIPYSCGESQNPVLGIVFNYLGYKGNVYIDKIQFFQKKFIGSPTDGYEEFAPIDDPADVPSSPEKDASSDKGKSNKGLVIGLSVGGGVVALCGISYLVYFLIRRKRRTI
jgi:mannan endo-1,4-beta-mannosidase